MDRAPGLSVRLKLTLSYAGFLMLAGALLLAAVWVFLLRYVPRRDRPRLDRHRSRGVFPVRSASCTISRPGSRSAGVPAGLRSRGRLASRRPDARPLTRITDATRWPRPDRYPTESGSGSQGRVPRARRRLRRHARAARGTRGRTAKIRGQRLPRARTPLAITQTLLESPATTDRDNGELVERLHAVNTRAIDLTEACSCSAAPTSGPSPQNTSTCPSSPRKPRKRCSPSRRNAASPSRPPATRPPPRLAARSCCN